MNPESTDLKLNGTQFVKEILKFGRFRHPNPKFTKNSKYNWEFTPAVADQLISNFKAGAVESVKLIDAHDEDGGKRLGAIVDLIRTEHGVDAVIDVEDQSTIGEIKTRTADGKPLAHGVSSGLDYGFPNYDADKPDTWSGPVLRHVALVSIPWIQGMKDWRSVEEGIAASHSKFNFGHEEYSGIPIVLGEKEESEDMDVAAQLSEILEKLNSVSHKLDEESKDTKKEEKDDTEKEPVVGLTQEQIQEQINNALAPVLAGITDAATKLAEANEAIASDQTRRNEENADAAVSKLLSTGKVLPKDKDTYRALYLANPDTFAAVTETLPVQVPFDESDMKDDPFDSNPYKASLSAADVTAEVDRLIALATPMAAGRSDSISRGDN